MADAEVIHAVNRLRSDLQATIWWAVIFVVWSIMCLTTIVLGTIALTR